MSNSFSYYLGSVSHISMGVHKQPWINILSLSSAFALYNYSVEFCHMLLIGYILLLVDMHHSICNIME